MHYSPQYLYKHEEYVLKYKILKTFPGSPDGMRTITFKQGEEVSHAELGEALAAVALKEKWIKKAAKKTTQEKQPAAEVKADAAKTETPAELTEAAAGEAKE